jgi:hypothetical protein
VFVFLYVTTDHKVNLSSQFNHLYSSPGQPSWLTPLLTPNEIPLRQQSPVAQDVLTALAPSMIEIAQWLTAAGGLILIYV